MNAGIVTLQLDEPSFANFTALRTRHFPPERNYLSAHVTLFHALPLKHFDEIDRVLAQEARGFEPFDLRFSHALFLGAGTAVAVESAALMALRARLAMRFSEWLTRQDANGFRPHITIQNKVGAREAKIFYSHFRENWRPATGRAEGLDLWVYEGGPWGHLRTYGFTSSCETTLSPF